MTRLYLVRKSLMALLALFIGNMAVDAQTIAQIRDIYADAKKYIADNGKNGMAPLDIKMTLRSGTEVGPDDFIEEISELTFNFTKYRIDSSLDYPDASSCYFVTENWSCHGHTCYRETLFDPNEGYLLFSFMRAETDAGYVVESRYYYGAEGQLIDQKHKLGGKEATANAQSWSTAEGDKELADKYLAIFEMLMNQKNMPTAKSTAGRIMKGDPARMKVIRDTYAKAKEKVGNNSKSNLPHDLQIIIRDQSWGPEEVTNLNFYYDALNQSGSDSASPAYHCYFISGRHHHNNMGPDVYNEYLFNPQSPHLLFSYCKSVEENQKNEWRYYYDDNGLCIEAKTDADKHDYGADDKQTAKRYIDLFNKVCEVAIR